MDAGFLIFAAVALLVIAAIAFSIWSQKKRTEAWQQVADELGIQFRGDQNDVLARCRDMKAFGRGSSQRVKNAVAGDAGDVAITLGDYSYTTGSGKNRHTHTQTICVLQSQRLGLPRCFLRPESRLFDAIGAAFGGQDVDFEEDPEFSRAYVLQGEDETAVRRIFGAEVRGWFAARAGSGLQFETRGDTLVFHTGKCRRPGEAKQFMQDALEIMNLLADDGGPSKPPSA